MIIDRKPRFTWFSGRSQGKGAGAIVRLSRINRITSMAEVRTTVSGPPRMVQAPNKWIDRALGEARANAYTTNVLHAYWLVFAPARRNLQLDPYVLHKRAPLGESDFLLQDIEMAHAFADMGRLDPRPDMEGALEHAVATVIAFARRYGPLGNGAIVMLRDQGTGRRSLHYAEPLLYWLSEARTMSIALDLASETSRTVPTPREAPRAPFMSTPTPAGLVTRIERVFDPISLKYSSHDLPAIDPKETSEEYLARLGSARAQVAINASRQATVFQDLFGAPQVEADSASLQEAWDRFCRPDLNRSGLDSFEQRQAEFELICLLDHKLRENTQVRSFSLEKYVVAPLPTNLLGALYLALAYKIRGDGDKPRCDYRGCGKLISHRKRRNKHGNFCDSLCRSREHRARKLP